VLRFKSYDVQGLSMEENNLEQLSKQSLTEHLAELRSCLLVSLGAVAVGFAIAYGFIRPISDWFFKPLMHVLPQGRSLIFTSYQEGFFFI
jgi:Sec-independent protein secretion pathway component TatC